MKTDRNILIAFILNLAFSVFEFIGGIVTGSVAILSDAVHDMADAASIGISFLLERKSKKQPDDKYTYGYSRFSVFGSFITTSILILGSVAMVYNSINRILKPIDIHYNGMIIFAVIGVCVNFSAAFLTHGGKSLNQRAVNLHMLEDVLGWVVVLIGSVVMRFTDFALIDPLMSIGVSLFILINSFKNLKAASDVFLEKIPQDVEVEEIRQNVKSVSGVIDVHHIHLWTMDGQNHYATMHIVSDGDFAKIKEAIRKELRELGVMHVTIEIEEVDEDCKERMCIIAHSPCSAHCHHGHHAH